MTTRRTFLGYGRAASLAATGASALAQADAVAKAKSEGKVAIYTSTDLAQGLKKLLDAFKAAYPGVTPEWNDLGTTSVYNRLISEVAAKQVGGHVAWSSGVDLQIAAIDKGLAEPHLGRDGETAEMGALQGRGLRHDLRARRRRLQQA